MRIKSEREINAAINAGIEWDHEHIIFNGIMEGFGTIPEKFMFTDTRTKGTFTVNKETDYLVSVVESRAVEQASTFGIIL